MQSQKLQTWIHAIFATEEDEIDCEVCFEVLSTFVDAEISQAEAMAWLPYVRQHLECCVECRELYQVLREVAQLEAEGRLPEPDTLWS